jgi:phosphoribosylformylglycinamidine (FGAM) synthase-like amidotransferase family enzyme
MMQEAYKIPIAHGEGNYFADADVVKAINDNDQVMFRYCDEAGNITTDANPNGSIGKYCRCYQRQRNVFGLMPHPERAADAFAGNEDGLAIFESILSLVKA